MIAISRFETCYQIALAIKDEVEDLEKAGINVIQIDEAALREGLPLRKSEHAFYLKWAVHSFRITNCGVQDTTQVCVLPHSFHLSKVKTFLFTYSMITVILIGLVFKNLTDPHPHVLLQLQ